MTNTTTTDALIAAALAFHRAADAVRSHPSPTIALERWRIAEAALYAACEAHLAASAAPPADAPVTSRAGVAADIPADVVARAVAFFEGRYGPLGDWLSLESARQSPAGWHVRAYIATFGHVYALIHEDGAGQDYLAEER